MGIRKMKATVIMLVMAVSLLCVQEFLKSVAELEGHLDSLEGLGLLLAGGCVAEDKEVILKRSRELRCSLSLSLPPSLPSTLPPFHSLSHSSNTVGSPSIRDP